MIWRLREMVLQKELFWSQERTRGKGTSWQINIQAYILKTLIPLAEVRHTFIFCECPGWEDWNMCMQYAQCWSHTLTLSLLHDNYGVQCFFSAIATVLVKHGTLKKGSIVLADDTFAKVTLYNRTCLNSLLLTAFGQVIRSCGQEKC